MRQPATSAARPVRMLTLFVPRSVLLGHDLLKSLVKQATVNLEPPGCHSLPSNAVISPIWICEPLGSDGITLALRSRV
jgi:hypothetical protein